MKTMIYIARADKGYRDSSGVMTITDSFDLVTTYSLDEARAAMESDWEGLTSREKKLYCRHWIAGYSIDVEDGETAKEAYARWADELCWLPDPDFSEDLV